MLEGGLPTDGPAPYRRGQPPLSIDSLTSGASNTSSSGQLSPLGTQRRSQVSLVGGGGADRIPGGGGWQNSRGGGE